MNTCKTCKWWRAYSVFDGGYCLNACKIDTDDSYIKDGLSLSIISDAEDNHTTIQVGPDFGCIHHEPREENNANK